MAVTDRAVVAAPSEATPLLSEPPSDASSETLQDGSGSPLQRADSNAPNQSITAPRATLLILSLWVLIFLQASNMSGLTTTQSRIAADLDAYSEASWFTSSYLIAMSSIAPLAGRLAQIFSARNCIFGSSIVFAVGGLVTSQSHSFGVFLVGRALSGVGAAGILTISIILVLELTTKRTRGLFIGLVNAGYTSGVALGAVIAGALVDVTGWRVLFGVQTPLALIAGSAVFFIIPEEFESGPRSAPGTEKDTMRQKLGKIDYLGAVTLTSTIVLFLYGMASAQIQWIPIAVAPVLLAGFVVNEVYWAKVPVIPVSVLASRGALFSCVAQLGLMAARWMVLFYSPVYAMAVRGWDGAAAGSMLIPTNVGFALGSLIVGWFHVKRSGSFWLPCVVIFVCFSVTLFILGQLSTATSPAWVYFVATFANGFCTGAALNYTLAHMLHISLPSVHFIVTGLLATFRGFAGSFGSAIGAGIFGRVLESSLVEGFREKGLSGKEELIRKLLGGPALVAGLQGVEHEVAVNAYTVALQRLFTAASGLALFVVLLQAGTGWHKPVEKDDRDSGVRTGASDSD